MLSDGQNIVLGRLASLELRKLTKWDVFESAASLQTRLVKVNQGTVEPCKQPVSKEMKAFYKSMDGNGDGSLHQHCLVSWVPA